MERGLGQPAQFLLQSGSGGGAESQQEALAGHPPTHRACGRYQQRKDGEECFMWPVREHTGLHGEDFRC